MPALANHCSVLFGTGSVNVLLKRIKAAQSISVPFDTIPFPCIRLFQSTISAAPTSTFFGSQPRNGQVPPKGLESIIATSQPADRHLEAAVEAAAPVPMTTRSNLFVMATLLWNCTFYRINMLTTAL